MPMPTPITDAVSGSPFSAYSPRLNDDDQIGLNNRGNAQVIGQKPASLIDQFKSWFNRGPAEAQRNKEAAGQFIAEIREKYGSDVAAMAASDVKSQLQKGSPLTARRVRMVIAESAQRRNQIAARNDRLFARQLPAVGERAVREAFGDQGLPSFLNRAEVMDRMAAAIADDPSFSRLDSRGKEQAFINHCVRIGQNYLKQAASLAMMPGTTGLTTREQASFKELVTIRCPPPTRALFDERFAQMRGVFETLSSLKPGEAIPHEEIQPLLNFVRIVDSELAGQKGEGTLAGLDLHYHPEAQQLRQAMLGDMHILKNQINRALGLK